MARLMVLSIALFVLPAIAFASRALPSAPAHFYVEGSVYCDPCRAGFETPASTSLEGASVKIECKKRDTLKVVYTKEGVTGADGKFLIDVDSDHHDQMCDAVLIRSSKNDCAVVTTGRERARVILTNNNGIASDTRYANSMGFMSETALPSCTKIMQQYQLDDADD